MCQDFGDDKESFPEKEKESDTDTSIAEPSETDSDIIPIVPNLQLHEKITNPCLSRTIQTNAVSFEENPPTKLDSVTQSANYEVPPSCSSSVEQISFLTLSSTEACWRL